MTSSLGTFLLGSVLVVTVADAPQWRIRPYVALLGLGIVLSLAETQNPQLAKGFAGLIFVGLLAQRGEALGRRVGAIVGK